jgi:putative ABC transport system permease protein
MVLRRLRRRPITTGISMVGIGLATAVLMVSNFALDAIDAMIDFQFTVTQRQDIQVTFKYAVAPSAGDEIRNIDGVLSAEPFRAIAVRLNNGHLSHRTTILGLGQQRNLYRLMNSDSSAIQLPMAGIVLSDKLAKILDVSLGDAIFVQVLEDRRQNVKVSVTGITTEFSGTNAYMDRDALHRLLQEDRRISGAFLKIDRLNNLYVYDYLQRIPRTAALSIKSAALQSIRETIKKNQVIMQSFNTIFAAIIALGVVYNMARITMAEQESDLATLRVLGFTQLEVSLMFLGELMTVAVLAIPLGWIVGIGLCYSTVKGFESDLYRIPLVITNKNLLSSAAITLLSAIGSGLVVRRSLSQINLVEVLKSHG